MAQFEASENMSAGALRIENVSAGAFQVEKMSAGAFQIENMRSMKCHCGSGPDFDRPKLCFCMHEWCQPGDGVVPAGRWSSPSRAME